MRWTNLLWYVLDFFYMVIVLDTYDLVFLYPQTISYSLILYYCLCISLSTYSLLSLATVLPSCKWHI